MVDDAFSLLNRYISVSRETLEKLHIYHDLLIKWNKRINLIGTDTDNIWKRHFLDSLQLISLIPDLSVSMIDIGSGAGFPGMALAVYGANNVHLIESNSRKIAFLREIARVTGIHVTLHHSRIEDVRGVKAKIILARAVANLDKLLEYSEPQSSHETTYLFPKGKNYSKEIEEALRNWEFNCDVIPSVCDAQGVILSISNLKRRAV